MSRAIKPIIKPSSCIVIPVATQGGTVTLAQILTAAGIANSSGVLIGNVEAFRFVGVDARARRDDAGQQAFVKFTGGATYQLGDSEHYAKLRVSDKNPLGFWKTTPGAEVAFTSGACDIGSVTVAVRYKDVNFQ